MASASDSEETLSPDHRSLRCRRCNTPIASDRARIEQNGAHQHTFANLSGVIFRIGCFGHAANIHTVGVPSSEFSWFSGYQWQIVCCTGCGTHLGWAFIGTDHFYALILDRLTRPQTN